MKKNRRLSKESRSESRSQFSDMALQRLYERDGSALVSLRLIAAPNPKDDVSKEQMAEMVKSSKFSTETIHHLIEFIKTL